MGTTQEVTVIVYGRDDGGPDPDRVGGGEKQMDSG